MPESAVKERHLRDLFSFSFLLQAFKPSGAVARTRPTREVDRHEPPPRVVRVKLKDPETYKTFADRSGDAGHPGHHRPRTLLDKVFKIFNAIKVMAARGGG